MDGSGTEDLHVSDTEPAFAFACHDDGVFDECMKSEFVDLHATGSAAQLDVPKDT